MATIRKSEVQIRKLGEPEHSFRKVKPFEVEGDYHGEIIGFADRPTGVVIKAEITDIDNSEIHYGVASGFLSYDYTDGDATESYIDTFDIKNSFKEALGKACTVSIEFREIKDYEYPCITWYQA